MNELIEIIQPTLVTLVSLVIGFLAYKVKTYINIKITEEQQKQIVNVANAAVKFVEQVTGDQFISEDKLAMAKHRALQTLKNLNITITDEELTMWIESAVNGFTQVKVYELSESTMEEN